MILSINAPETEITRKNWKAFVFRCGAQIPKERERENWFNAVLITTTYDTPRHQWIHTHIPYIYIIIINGKLKKRKNRISSCNNIRSSWAASRTRMGTVIDSHFLALTAIVTVKTCHFLSFFSFLALSLLC